MGVTIREKPAGSGVLWIFINHHGMRKAKKIGKDKRLALEVAEKINAKLVLGEIGAMNSQPHHTFKEYSEKYMAFIKAQRRESTYERYSQVLRDYISPVFKNRTLDDITRGEIRDFLVSKSEKLNVSILRDVLSGIMGFALDDEVINVNPVLGATKKIEFKKAKEVDPFTERELSLLLDVPGEYYPFFLMATRTGLRLGELLAIRWEDIDFNHKVILEGGEVAESPFIWVRRSYRRGIFTPPKNGKSRKVDMSGQLKIALKKHLIREKKKTLKQGLGDLPELVFHREGKVIEQNYIRRVYKRTLSKAGLRYRKLHALRHSFASILLSKGESPVYVKEQLGHHSIQITVDIYGKWIQTKKEAGVNRLDDATIRNLSATNPSKSHLSI